MVAVFLLILTIASLIYFKNKPERVFGLLFIFLSVSGSVSTPQLISSFANQGVLTLVMLMLCSLALEKTQLLRKVAKWVLHPSYQRSWLHLFTFSAFFSAFLNNTAIVSTMLAPIRNHSHHAANRLLIPLSYAAILGGTLTLVGTSTNLIVNSMVVELGLTALSFFEFTKIGGLLLVCCGGVLFVSSRWLPVHIEQHKVVADYFIDTHIESGSRLVGKSIEQNGLRNLESLFLVEILRNKQLISPVAPTEVLQAGDRLLFSGDIKKVTLLKQFDGLTLFAAQNGLPLDNLSEVIVRPESVLVGSSLKKVGFRSLFDAAVVAIKRDGEPLSGKLGNVRLKFGDYLILAVGEDYSSRNSVYKNFYFASGVETEPALSTLKENYVVIGFLFSIGLAAYGVISLFTAMLVLLGSFLVTGVLTTDEVMRRLPVRIWLIISAALALSHAFVNSGVDVWLQQWVSSIQTSLSPLLLLVVIYLLTWLLTELVTNNAAAALMLPIVLSVANSLNIDPMPFIMLVAFAASASFISPYGYQTNLIVFNAGQYQISDFIKVGLPVALTYAVVTIFGVAYFYF